MCIYVCECVCERQGTRISADRKPKSVWICVYAGVLWVDVCVCERASKEAIVWVAVSAYGRACLSLVLLF